MAAVPVIMTLPTNASAQAFGSSLRCLINQPDQPDDYFAMTESPYQTEPVQCVQVAYPDGTNREYLADFSGTGSECYDATGQPWYPMDNGMYVPASWTSGRKWVVEGYTTALAYVYVDDNGKVQGIHPSLRSQGYQCVYGSCFLSIVGYNA